MEQSIKKLTLALMRSAIDGAPLSDEEKGIATAENVHKAIKLASSHDLSHLVAWSAKRNGMSEYVGADGEKHIFKAVYRYQQIRYEYERLCASLEKAQIQFIPLKGSVIRKHYPEPWMRTSCDIDILIRKDDLDRAAQMLTDELKYKRKEACSHDVAFMSPTGVNVEMHFDLIEEGLVNSSAKVLKNVWRVSTPKDGYEYFREMPDSFFYFYHIAHMAKHLLNGGCGIKPLIDLWLLERVEDADLEGREELLSRGGLLKLAGTAVRLSLVWFGKEEHNTLTKEMEKYVLEGGVYGNLANHVAVLRHKMGGRLQYALSLIFLPYDSIKYMYPILQKHRWLTPVMQARRWCTLILKGRLKKATRTLTDTGEVSDEQVKSVRDFLDGVGLI
jgi:hypothetical protein